MNRLAKTRIAITLVSLLLGGCASTPVTLSSQFAADAGPAKRHASPREEAKTCSVHLAHVGDSRLDPSTMGQVGPRVIRSPQDVGGWMRSAIATLDRGDIHVDVGDGAESANELVMDAELLKAWANAINTSIATTVVIHIRYSRSGALLKEAAYRGSDTSTNWANGEGEIQSHFDAVMRQALNGVDRDLAELCFSSAS